MTNKESLKKTLRDMKKDHDSKVFDLRRDFKHLREMICIASGGHFWFDEPFTKDVSTFKDPYKTQDYKLCEVCGAEDYIY